MVGEKASAKVGPGTASVGPGTAKVPVVTLYAAWNAHHSPKQSGKGPELNVCLKITGLSKARRASWEGWGRAHRLFLLLVNRKVACCP